MDETTTTPFAAPNDSIVFKSPAIPCAIFSVADHGGKGDGTTVNSKAFADTVAAASANCGGVVFVPAGKWLAGAIHLEDNIELHVDSGSTIVFKGFSAGSGMTDYPTVLTRWEGLDVMNWSPFVYALNKTNVAITGAGTLDGQGDTWWGAGNSVAEDTAIYKYYLGKLTSAGTLPTPLPAPPTSAKANGLRPAMVECDGCTNFLIDGPSVKNPPYWTLHPLYSTNVIVRNTTVTSTAVNTDGVDVDSSKDVLIERVTLSTGDDMIAIKSGLNEDGIAVGRPAEEIVIRNITAKAGHGISMGSEMSGGINNVFVTADAMNDLGSPEYLLRMKTMAGRGGTMENVWFQNATGSSTKDGILLTTHYGSSTIAPHNPKLIPHIKNVSVKNVSGSAAGAAVDLVPLSSEGFPNTVFDSIHITGATADIGCSTTGVTFVNGACK